MTIDIRLIRKVLQILKVLDTDRILKILDDVDVDYIVERIISSEDDNTGKV